MVSGILFAEYYLSQCEFTLMNPPHPPMYRWYSGGHMQKSSLPTVVGMRAHSDHPHLAVFKPSPSHTTVALIPSLSFPWELLCLVLSWLYSLSGLLMLHLCSFLSLISTYKWVRTQRSYFILNLLCLFWRKLTVCFPILDSYKTLVVSRWIP